MIHGPPEHRHVKGSYHKMTRNAQYEWTWFRTRRYRTTTPELDDSAGLQGLLTPAGPQACASGSIL